MSSARAGRAWRALAASACIGVLSFAQAPAGAQPAVNTSYLDGRDPVAPDAITAYGPELFGDKVNLFNGALEFEHTDLSVPGNSQLPVALVRRHTPGQVYFIRGQFGDWDLQTPRITGTFSAAAGWSTTTGGTNRCTGFSEPPLVNAWADPTGGRGGLHARIGVAGPVTPGPKDAGSSLEPKKNALVIVGFIASDYWRRTSIDVPGQGSQEVLKRSGAFPHRPNDGGAYPLVTHANWQIGCLPTVQNSSGEGFTAVSPEGVRYRFDWMATRQQTAVKKSGAQISRLDFALMATQVTDRFGNWVRYTYDSANPWLLTRIDASDGRAIDITNSGGRARSATDGTRTYTYAYGPQDVLSNVVLPDGSQWSFNLAVLQPADVSQMGEYASCDAPGDFPGDDLTGTLVHPSGAVGAFTLNHQLFGRTGVERKCYYKPNSQTQTTGAVWPKTVASQALVSKQISGVGMSTMVWSYAYDAPGAWSNCADNGSCKRETRIVTVTDPMGVKVRHVFGSKWRVNEGQLLQVDEGWNGTSALKSTSYRYRLPDGQNFPDSFGTSLLPNSDWLSYRHRPQDQRVVTLQGQTFTWQADPSSDGFDVFVRPKIVRKFSSLGYSKTESTQYWDNANKWVLGQVAKLTELTTGREIESNTYDWDTATKTQSFSFGKKTNSYVYNADGTLAIVRDAADREIRLTQYKRGKPQVVSYPDGTSESQSINNLGNPDWRTNAAGTTTSYLYDPMGRVARITYPGGDAASYHPTTQVFEPVGTAEYGLPAGHWRQTISTGNARKIRYFDAMWRKRLELRYDAASPSTTTSFEETRYDANGRKSFESYPERSFSGVDVARAGRATSYDAIDRVVLQRADSELGVLQTVTQYPGTAFQRVVTNPRGYNTTTSFQAFDAPTEDSITQISAPEGVVVAIVRDVFGKALSITRAGPGVSATRSYVYDGHQRLCKTVEPETGATVQDYDPAGNVAWRASGLVLPGLSSCDQASVPEGRKIRFTYDPRDRLTGTTYGDGSAGVSRTYTPDGLPLTINTNGFAWTLGYNNRRLMVSESLATGLGTYSFGYGIDSHGQVASMSYPGGPTLSYSPDAFGRPTRISGYAVDIAYHPNGALGNYTAANGVAYSAALNVRGLPHVWRHAGVVQDAYSYDANGNVLAITDQQEGVTSRSMGYDGLDRLTAANGIWGTGAYAYDGLDNLIASQVGARRLSHNIDPSTNRLVSLTGSLNLGIGYDANGNIVQRGSQGFNFDIGNRLLSANGLASYAYDGLGRRGWAQMANGRTVLRIYSQSGRLLLTQDSQKGVTRHIHLGDKVIAETNSLTGTRWMHTDALGSPVATTGVGGAILERTRYEPYGATAAGSNPDGIGFTGHVNDPDTGMVYMQQRYYDPVASRFLSIDPVSTDAKTGDSFNRYAYGNDSPYKFTDPDGRHPVLWGIAAVVTRAVATIAGRVMGAAKAAARNEKQQDPMQRGREKEGLVLKDMGKDKNTTAVEAEGKKSIPDFQDSKQVGEIKDTKRVTDTEQIRTQREAAKAEGKEHVVVTGTKTDVSAPVQENSTVIRRPDLGPQ